MTTVRSQRLAGLGASLLLTAIVVALPVLLIATMPTYLPSMGSWDDLLRFLASPDDGTPAWLAIWSFACIVWILLTALIVTEVVAAIRGVQPSRLRVARWSQNLVRNLVATAALLFVTTPTLTALPAPVAVAQPIPTPPTPNLTSSPAKAAPTAPATVDYVVQRGDSLWRIAEHHLGDGNRYPEIVKLNSKLLRRGPDFIRQGWTIRLPVVERTNGFDSYTVREGDTLSEIALEELGNAHAWPRIAAASRSIVQPGGRRLTDPDEIDIGWTLHIPTRASAPAVETKPDPVDQPDPRPTPPTAAPTPTPSPMPTDTPSPTPNPSSGTSTASVPAPSDLSEPSTDTVDVEDGNEDVVPVWMLLGITGPGVILAGALWWSLRRRRRNQFRHRRPGRRPATVEPALVPVERSIHLAATTGADDLVQHLDAALKTLAVQLDFDDHAMPQLAAVQLNGDGIRLHLAEPLAQLPAPWTGEGSEWRLAPTHLIQLERSEQAAPYPLLVTVGADSDGGLWLVNAEQFGTLSVSGDPDYVTDLARAVTAELAVTPWAEDARVECIGVAGEVQPLNPARIRHHHEPTHVVDLVTGAIDHAERLDATDAPDTPTARATDADLDTWPGHLLVITGDHAELAGPLRSMVVEQPGRTGTAVVLVGAETIDDSNLHLNLTSNGRLAIPELGLDLVPAGITSDEAEGFARLLVQADTLADAPIRVNSYAEQGWETLADQTGAIRKDLTVPRDAPDDATTTNLLPETDDEYLDTAATTADDLARLAPKVPIATSAAVAAADPTLDADLADWHDPACVRPKLRLLGPVAVELADGGEPAVVGARKGSFVELLAFLATRTRGATTQQVADALRIDHARVRHTVNRLRDWLGEHPDSKQPYVPLMSRTHATKTSGVRAYELQGVLVDADLFRRLRLRGQAKGPAGLDDLRTALSLVTGEPLTGFKDNRGNWVYDGDRVDQQHVVAIADVAHIVATAEHQVGNHLAAREAALIALKADPYGETARLDYRAAGGRDLGEPPDLPQSPFPSDEDWPERTREIGNHTVREKASRS
ncbi:MAG: LysM peptidoglycan-binding domain-containing protein [Actinobacteria bacterium]|nr:LysM peptidoglycan-binding domain-containing protein [Actinomycetota bacterium]